LLVLRFNSLIDFAHRHFMASSGIVSYYYLEEVSAPEVALVALEGIAALVPQPFSLL
jgi:hypothetical protein